jgi:prepilin-type N-terminal cleavage/methylation domain-containing protein
VDRRSRSAGKKRFRASAGFSLIESLAAMALFGFLAVLSAPSAGKWIRRSEGVAAFSTIRQVLAVARLEAVRRGANVAVVISATPDRRIRLRTFQDRALDPTTPLPPDEQAAAGNFVQDIGAFATSPATDEPTLGDITLGPRIHLWKQGGGEDDPASAIRFDDYAGNAALTDRIVFLPAGGILAPQDPESGQPAPSGGRGIYFGDWQGKNYYRVTIDSDLTGKCRVDKYVDGSGYRPTGWAWR